MNLKAAASQLFTQDKSLSRTDHLLRARNLFGSNLRSLRVQKGLSQENLAHSCNLHRTYIGSIERGERNISIDNMERIAVALNTELPDLLRNGRKET